MPDTLEGAGRSPSEKGLWAEKLPTCQNRYASLVNRADVESAARRRART